MGQSVMFDGNEAAADVAYRTNEVIAIYPITPASPMGELADAWAARGRQNLDGVVPRVVEMQSEGGAAGAVHGALQGGSLSTTFTASQGLLLMIPNMYKIAGELTPTVFHVAARTVATHALSIFGDHSDVMAVRQTGWAMLAAASPQEAHDLALVAQAATLRSRVPFLHFFDGFRTSHELNQVERLEDDVLRAMLPGEAIDQHRRRALDPDRPVLRGTAQNPDVFFQAREAINPYYEALPAVVADVFNDFAGHTGRRYRLFDYQGPADAERVIVLMGSGAGAVQDALRSMPDGKIGLLQVRLYRPFDAEAMAAALPATTRRLAVLDRTKEPGAVGEPLYQDVVTAVSEAWAKVHGDSPQPEVIGGRYGLSSKEFSPAMARAVFEELQRPSPKRHFTIGIVDDVSGASLKWDADWDAESADVVRAVFYGLGSDGTVGANKATAKIVGQKTKLTAQGYFVYDSKKAGAMTVSHLRFSPRPIAASYLISQASFVACHQFEFLKRLEVLAVAAPGATVLINCPHPPEAAWEALPLEVQETILAKRLRVYVVDAGQVARDAGLGSRINTVMQTCFFALTDLLPEDEALAEIKASIQSSYGRLGQAIVDKNNAAVDAALAGLAQIEVPSAATAATRRQPPVPAHVPDFVERVTARIIAGHGDLLPVSAFPVDGTFPTATARYEKRSIAHEIPIWDEAICIQCGLCALVCPHAAIRMKPFAAAAMAGAPDTFKTMPWKQKGAADQHMAIQVAPDDCTGCGVCVDVCPAKSKEVVRHKAINMEEKHQHLVAERANWDFFLSIPEASRTSVNVEAVKESQILEPLFEFSGACAGCGETPYLKLLSQLFGERMLVANATGCSSIYGGNLPTTPWSVSAAGRGPAWSNSLFEDNAEFGLGMRLAVDQKTALALAYLDVLKGHLPEALVTELRQVDIKPTEVAIVERRELLTELGAQLERLDHPAAHGLAQVAEVLVPRSVWIVGGDGWAYDIGFGGLDHVLASGADVNVLVLDTGVYSNTGGQASKATPRAATAKFAAQGKTVRKKDLGMLAVAYGNVYVAQLAMGASPKQTLRAMHEAESFAGPSLLIAYSQCIAHGIPMATGMTHQKDAVNSGFWPLYRYDPRHAHAGDHPFRLDSRKPTLSFEEFAKKEARFAMLMRADPERAKALVGLAQRDIDDQWHYYEQTGALERVMAEDYED